MFLFCATTFCMERIADNRVDGLVEGERRRGRGAVSNASGRYEAHAREAFDDGWAVLRRFAVLQTQVVKDHARTILTHNQSPIFRFRLLSTLIGVVSMAAFIASRGQPILLWGCRRGLILRAAFSQSHMRRICWSANWPKRAIAARDSHGHEYDPYQPIEREYRISRSVLKVLERTGNPVAIVTKSHLVTRDIDILSRMAARNLVKVALSVTTLEANLHAQWSLGFYAVRRLEAMKLLSDAGIPTMVMFAPVIRRLMIMRWNVFWNAPLPMARKRRAMWYCACPWKCAIYFDNG